METTWFPTRVRGRVTHLADAGVLAEQMKASLVEGGVLVSATAGLFFHGKLIANLLDGKGNEIKSADLTVIALQTALEWQQKIELQGVAKRITIQLFDDQGGDKDRGLLVEAEIDSGRGSSN